MAGAPISHAHVERLGEELMVTWRGGGDVAVFVSTSPDDAGIDVRSPDGPGRVTVPADPVARTYVHLLADDGPFVVVAERQVPLQGAHNFRDLGGYRTVDGRQVRWGRVYRSDHLGELVDADHALLAGLGVQVVVDYRNPHEHAETPSAIVEGGPILRLDRPISDGNDDGVSFWDRLRDGSLPPFGADELAAFYLETLARSAPTFGEVLGLVADPARHAVVFHCTAGKDRTGLTAALLLAALGVPDASVLDDYELTNRFRSRWRVEELRAQLAEVGIDIDRYLALFTAPRPALAATLAGVRDRWGSIEGYLTGPAGLPERSLVDLRTHLVVP